MPLTIENLIVKFPSDMGKEGASYWALRALAKALLVLGWQGGALAVFQRILHGRPQDLHASGSAAHLLGQAGRWPEAIRLLKAAVAVHASHAATWFNLAYMLEADGRETESEPVFRTALALDPAMDRAWYGLALVLMREDRLDEAAQALEETTRLQPLSPYGWYQLGKVRAQQGQDDSALQVIRHLRSFEPRVAARLAQECGLESAGATRS